MPSITERSNVRACAPWCVEHRDGVCFSERRCAGSADARLSRSLDGHIYVSVYVRDFKLHGRDGLAW